MYNFCGNEYFENLATIRSGHWKVFWEIEVFKCWEILKDYKSEKNPLKMFTGVHFFGKAAGPQYAILLKNKLHYKRFSNNLSTF